ncbi:MAG: hypothetical protein E7604_12715 [Ruminococcaceae bacterium]|nr:hypothetical protein [Oscillospiraceae bacterium]
MTKSVNILDFGAIPNDNSDSTEAIRRAVSAGAGGTVIFPEGVFLCGSIQLYGDTEYVFDKGCVLRAAEISAFTPIGFRHNEMGDTTSMLWAIGENNISLRGEGIIDLGAWRYYHTGVPVSGEMYQKNTTRLNQPIFFESCRNIRIEGLRFEHSPCWTLTFSRSSIIVAENLTIVNDTMIPNSDGIHFSACQKGIVRGCTISGGDDCIALTCITDFNGCNRDITVYDCELSSNSAAVRIGHNAERIRMERLHIRDTNRGIGIFTRDGTIIRDIAISDIELHTKPRGLCWWGNGDGIVISAVQEKSRIDNVQISCVRGTVGNGIIVYGNAQNVKNVKLSDISLTCIGEGNSFLDLRPYLSGQLPEKNIAYIIHGTKNTVFEEVKVNHVDAHAEYSNNANLTGEIVNL